MRSLAIMQDCREGKQQRAFQLLEWHNSHMYPWLTSSQCTCVVHMLTCLSASRSLITCHTDQTGVFTWRVFVLEVRGESHLNSFTRIVTVYTCIALTKDRLKFPGVLSHLQHFNGHFTWYLTTIKPVAVVLLMCTYLHVHAQGLSQTFVDVLIAS